MGQQIHDEVYQKNIKLNSTENIACQNLWDATKVIHRGKFLNLPWHTYFRNKGEKIND